MRTEIRMYIAELLLRLIIWIVPVDHKDGRNLIIHIKSYAEEVLTTNPLSNEK